MEDFAAPVRARFALAFDTSNEVIATGIGRLIPEEQRIEIVASAKIEARRASNTKLISCIDEALRSADITRADLACIVVGRGPGSFTGVRIAMATAKGIASALGVGLVGVSTSDAVAWGMHRAGVRGGAAVVADAMRKEVYPCRYRISDNGIERIDHDSVAKAADAAESLGVSRSGVSELVIAGDALAKYEELFSEVGSLAASELWTPAGAGLLQCTEALWRAGEIDPFDAARLAKYEELFSEVGSLAASELWTPAGAGLLQCTEALWRAGEIDPFDAARHHPAYALPVYTRLSDAEENERARLARAEAKNLVCGVQGETPAAYVLKPLDAARAAEVAALEARVMGTDAWSAALVADELPRKDRTWWMAVADEPTGVSCRAAEVAALEARVMGTDAWSAALVADELPRKDRTWWMAVADEPTGVSCGAQGFSGSSFESTDEKGCAQGRLVGYAGGWIVDGDVQILKVGVDPAWRRRGIARELLARVAADARDLGARTSSLEVRVGNAGARALYAALGYEELGTRPRYYSDGEDAVIMRGPLPQAGGDVAGMAIEHHGAQAKPAAVARPLIFAIESSCDETAAAIVDGQGRLVADVVASQIDFHARFGGVVPEIASRKHIEAICGVCDECFEVAARALGVDVLSWADLDAVSVTYAPGLVGALVVGVAFAKGAAWAADKPFIGVNHLEGHLYANKIGVDDFEPPAVVSLVSGGNTMLVHMRGWGDYETLGSTIDDAVGEAFDKVAKALGLGYPGGPVISRLAAQGDPEAIAFPRAMLHSGDLRFSLSGLKTAVTTYINQEREAGRPLNMPDIAASFQQAVIDVQVAKAKTALMETQAKTFCFGGGVAANPALRAAYERMCDDLGVRIVMPPLSSCGDNAGMIALVALDRYRAGKFFSLDADAHAHTSLDDPY